MKHNYGSQDPHIYHFVMPDYFHQYDEKSDYYPARFEQEGFIHCCFVEQIDHVITHHFRDVDDVYILKLDQTKILAKLIVEGEGHPLGFPHIYGPINMDAIISREHKLLP